MMQTLGEVLSQSTHYLEKKGIQGGRRKAEEMLVDTLGINRLSLYLDIDRPLIEKELEACRKYLVRLSKGEPSAYIRGYVDFYGCRLKVSSDVLIPRPETEILVDHIVKELKNQPLEGKTIWDVCTGSGCIAIALKKALPQLKVVAGDISKKALSIAQENAHNLGVDIQFLEGDLLNPFTGQADYVISNPPYISHDEYVLLSSEVADFEPQIALIADENGLNFYRRLANGLKGRLLTKGWLEIGSAQGEGVKKILESEGWSATVLKDWAGHDRFVLFS